MGKRFGRARLSVLCALAVCLSACSASSTTAGTSGQPQPVPTAASSAAETYLQTAFLFVRDDYYYAGQVNWGELQRKVFQRAENARTTGQTYPAIRYLLSSLRPSLHTFFMTPAEAGLFVQQKEGVGIGAVAVRQPDGLTVVALVVPSSPAAEAGIQPGDVVLGENGRRPPNNPISTFSSSGSTFTLQLRHRDKGPAFTVRLRAQLIPPGDYPDERPLPDGVGYVDLPGFDYGPLTPQAQTYATDAQSAIRSIAASSTCGWIVELRRDTGGDFFPMVEAIILGDGAGSFVNGHGVRIPWSYESGSFVDGQSEFQVPDAYALSRPDTPVAVLTSPLTASAGEATLIPFLGRPYTRTFGEPTGGAPSAPAGKVLSDGAYISIVYALDANRRGHVYQDHVPIRPDQEVTPNWTQIGLNTDPTLEAAEAWLKAQPACAG